MKIITNLNSIPFIIAKLINSELNFLLNNLLNEDFICSNIFIFLIIYLVWFDKYLRNILI